MKSYNLTDLANRILRHFIHIEEVVWVFDDVRRIPSQHEIMNVLKRSSKELLDNKEASSITTGGIHINKYGEDQDVYVYIGTIDPKEV
jgi:hypothetical protein